MRNLICFLLFLSFFGCATYPAADSVKGHGATTRSVAPQAATVQCPGDVEPPPALEDKFEPAEDEALLSSSLGEPMKGKLCRGKVYKSKANSRVNVYRAWNSTNPKSEMGSWWAFHGPSGKVAKYRSDYEICYQWSPLDKLTHCILKDDVKIVIGTGQSAECSQYLSYPASPEKQIYMENTSNLVMDCVTYDGEFSWKAAN